MALVLFLLVSTFLFVTEEVMAQPSLSLPFPIGKYYQCTQGPQRCEGGNNAGAICQQNSNCSGGGTCISVLSHFGDPFRFDLDFGLSHGADVIAAADGVAYVHAATYSGCGKRCVGGSKDSQSCTKDSECPAIAPGQPLGRCKSGNFGNHVNIDHGNGFFTVHAHLESFSVSNEQMVKRGEKIGTSNNSGYSCNDHLHFGLHTGDATKDGIDSTSVLIDTLFVKDRTAGTEPKFISVKEIVCGTGTLGHLYEAAAPPPEPGPGFDFAVSFVAIDGNIGGSGNPDGAIDFLDNFNDNRLDVPPTSRFTCFSTVEESGGFLHLRSADNANTFTPGVLVDNCQLGVGIGTGSTFLLQDGGGDSVITASFRADIPHPGTSYALQLITLGTNEVVGIQVSGDGTTAEVQGTAQSASGTQVVQSMPVNLTGVQFITLRLEFRDSDNRVFPSFSTDFGNTFTPINLPSSATVMTAGTRQGFVAVLGFVGVQ